MTDTLRWKTYNIHLLYFIQWGTFYSFQDAGYERTLIVFHWGEWNLKKCYGIKVCLVNRNTIKDKNTLLTGCMYCKRERERERERQRERERASERCRLCWLQSLFMTAPSKMVCFIPILKRRKKERKKERESFDPSVLNQDNLYLYSYSSVFAEHCFRNSIMLTVWYQKAVRVMQVCGQHKKVSYYVGVLISP